MRPDLPSGTVTFLFTDIEGSTRLLYELGDRYADALAEHRRLLRGAASAHGGTEVDTQGDAFFFAFARATEAVAAAQEAQSVLASGPIRVRIGLHTGEPILTEEGYVGLDVHKGARIAAAGHGGQTLLSEATRRLVDATVHDLGLHRLKDLQAPERICQLGEGEFPPLKSLNQTNLPIQPTPFLGRERELAEVLERLRREEVRLLTLVGPGGSGKTRLALQAAAELVDDYPDGVWFVGLATLIDPSLVLPTIAQTLGVRDSAHASHAEALAEHLRTKRMLLVLDNLEQLLPDVAAPLGELSRAAPRVDLITSSREPLHLSAEQQYPVPPLSLEEAIALFAERARATRPDFVFDGARPTVEAICTRLDRLPLAIELAAARVKLLPPDKLLSRLEQRLPLLTGGAPDAPERQHTLRSTIAWSFDLLAEDEQRLFARLAVFSGGCTLEAAEEICDADIDTLQSLIDKSLVREEDGPGGEPRYVMLETIREFALERLEARDDAKDLRRRHAEHFLSLAEEAEPQLKGPRQPEWIDRLEAEHDNARAALRWLLDGGQPELGLRLAASLWLFWYVHGHVSEGRRLLAEALERTPPAPTVARATALDGAGYLASDQGDGGLSLLEESFRCAREAGSPSAAGIAATHVSLNLPPERLNEAVELGEEAVALGRESGDRYVLAVALNNLGELMREVGDNARAAALYEESYVLRREIGDLSRVALSLVNLAEMAFIAGDMGRARSLSSQALELARPLGDRRHMCLSLMCLGWIALGKQSPEESERLFREALVLARDIGNAPMSVVLLHGLAGAAAARGEAPRAARLAAAAEQLKASMGHLPTLADVGLHEHHLETARGQTNDAVWEAARKDGAAMSLDEAIAYGLGEERADET